MNQQAPAPSPPALPVSLAANPKLSSWLKFSSDRTGDGLARQGRDRTRHRDGAGADRRRRTRYRSVARADDPRVDGHQPQRGRHLGQPLHPAVGPRDAPRLRRGSPDLSSTGGGTAGRRCRCARHRGRHHFGTRQCQDQLLGTCRRSLARSRRHAGRNAEDRIAPGVGREFSSADRHSGQGVWAGRASSTIRRWRACCMAACCGRRTRARNLSN